MHTLKLICITNFSSLGLFSFSSTFISYHQLLTADDSWYGKNFTWIFMYPLKLKHVPNFSSLGWFSFSPAVDNWPAVQNYFWELDSHIGPKTRFYAEFHIDWLIGSRARECDARQTDTNCQTPSEDRSNLAMLSWARAWVRQLQTTFKIFWFEYNENWLITCETYCVDEWGEISVDLTNGVMHGLIYFLYYF